MAERANTMSVAELGRRLRDARTAAGLGLAEIATDGASEEQLQQIESGRRRPSEHQIELIAARLVMTPESLLGDAAGGRGAELLARLDRAELAVAAGNPRRALAIAGEVLADLGAEPADEIKTAALEVQAGALESLGDLAGAIALLTRLAERPSPEPRWLRNLIALSRCHRDNGEFAQAVAVGENAQAAIRELGLEGVTEAIQLKVTIAGAYHSWGKNEKAMRLCMEAVEVAERHGSEIGKASAYWNASVIERSRRGTTPRAVELAANALTAFERGADNRNLAKLRAHLARLQLDQSPPDPVASLTTLADSERELALVGGSACDTALIHLTRARVHLQLEDRAAALESVRLGIRQTPDSAAELLAEGESLLGQIAAGEGRTEDAQAHYLHAVMALSQVGADHGAAQLWFELARLLNDSGDVDGALAAYRSAGASNGLQVHRLPLAAAADLDTTTGP